MKLPLILLIILIIPFVSSLCEDNQIDINSASLEKLDQITQIGPSKGQSIIDYRPFYSLDELVKVPGIAEITLGKIKSQGLACVSEKVESEIKEKVVEEVKEEIIVEEKSKEPIDLKVIELNPKVIKTDDSEESYNLYAILGLVTFSVLLTLLFLLKKQKENKNEFD